MMMIRKSDERGFADHGWLKSHHTFSFANYYDPQQMGFATLRVINEDHIDGGTGFPAHPHRDMEIITYVVSGALEHKDSMGNSTIIRPGEVQRMSAGTGVRHSEYNHESEQKTHLLQIWILPEETGVTPGYGQKSFESSLRERKLVLTVSKNGRDGSISINQDADVYVSRLSAGDSIDFDVRPDRKIWLQLIRGQLTVNDTSIQAGDGIALSEEKHLKLAAARENAEFILFDLV